MTKTSPRNATSKKRSVKDNRYDEILSGMEGFARKIQALNKQAVEQYTPLVNDLISDKCRNKKQIECNLDQLLSFCGYDPAVKIYRKLCRYYSQIDQQAAAEYAKIYFEMWEQ
jgi:hypothetical protein